MSEAGIGVDIVDIDRMARVLQKTPSFKTRVFTDEERSYCDATSRPAVHYACRFAAREAVLKALGTGFSQGCGRKDVSVSRDPQGRPYAILNGRAREIAESLNVQEVAISLSFTRDLAVANAMAITPDDRPRPKEDKESEKAVIARSFREARSILDDLDVLQESELASVDPNGSQEVS